MEKSHGAAKPRRPRAERDALAARCEASGKSVVDFAAEHNLPTSSLYHWMSAWRASNGDEKAPEQRPKRQRPQAAFAEVKVVGRVETGDVGMTVTVVLAGGNRVIFEGQVVDPAWLGSILKVVSAC